MNTNSVEMISNNDLITIIVPVYQVNQFLSQCLDSLVNQTYKNLEIILIDDGSDDGSELICDKYAQKDSRIKVIHQSNKGLSEARNTGLEAAQGDYIAFVDSDDIVSTKYIESLYTLIIEHNADISICSYIKSQNEQTDNSKEAKIYVTNAKQMLQSWHGEHKYVETVVWNKLYRKEVFNLPDKLRFPAAKNHEDVYISHLLINRAQNIVITSQKLYTYRVRNGSITKSNITEHKIRQNIDAQLSRLSFFEDNHYNISRDLLIKGLLLHLMMYKMKLILNKNETDKLSRKQLFKEMKALYKKYYSIAKKSPNLNIKEKVMLFAGNII